MTSGELSWLSSHLGHNLETHKAYYRQQQATIELSKVSRLLIATDAGILGHYHGKKLSEIPIDGN